MHVHPVTPQPPPSAVVVDEMSDERCELVEIVLVYVVVCGFDVVCLHGLPVKAALASHSGSDTANADDKLPQLDHQLYENTSALLASSNKNTSIWPSRVRHDRQYM